MAPIGRPSWQQEHTGWPCGLRSSPTPVSIELPFRCIPVGRDGRYKGGMDQIADRLVFGKASAIRQRSPGIQTLAEKAHNGLA